MTLLLAKVFLSLFCSHIFRCVCMYWYSSSIDNLLNLLLFTCDLSVFGPFPCNLLRDLALHVVPSLRPLPGYYSLYIIPSFMRGPLRLYHSSRIIHSMYRPPPLSMYNFLFPCVVSPPPSAFFFSRNPIVVHSPSCISPFVCASLVVSEYVSGSSYFS